MKIAYFRLVTLLVIVMFILGILPLVTGAVHKDASAISGDMGLSRGQPALADAAIEWSFEGLALLLSACGALFRQVFRIRNG